MIDQDLVTFLCKNLEDELPINQPLAEGGMLHMDKMLPYICVYRYKKPDLYFSGLLKTQASYLIVKDTEPVSELLECIATQVSKKLNSFLILEMWPVRKDHGAEFEISCPKGKAPATIKSLKNGIDEMRLIYPEVSAVVSDTHDRHPDRLEPLLNLQKNLAVYSLAWRYRQFTNAQKKTKFFQFSTESSQRSFQKSLKELCTSLSVYRRRIPFTTI